MEEPKEEDNGTFGQRCKWFWSDHWRGVLTLSVPIIFSPILITHFMEKEYRCLYLVVVMAIYWITEVVPLYVTSFLPLVYLPIAGILDSARTCQQYFKDSLALFLGGLIFSLSVEYSNLHKRVALRAMQIVGTSPRRLHFAVTFITMFISLWVSNSATTAMMCPIIKAILEELDAEGVIKIYKESDEEQPIEERQPSNISMAFYFVAAYASSFGGCGTLIGTVTNVTLQGLYETRFPDSTEPISFPLFAAYSLPQVLICTICLYFWIEIVYMGLWRPNSEEYKQLSKANESKDVIRDLVNQNYKELGPMTCHEIQVSILFFIMIALFLTLRPGFVTGWGDIMNAVRIKNSLPVMFIVCMLFILPIHYHHCRYLGGKGPFTSASTPGLLSWSFTNVRTPWGFIFLIGGGFALAEASVESGMAKMIGDALSILKGLPPSFVIFLAIAFAMFMTAFSSNTAICNIIVPIMSEMAITLKIHPLKIIFPVGIACSYAFHLPVSTLPNAIIAGYANIRTKHMAFAGIGPSIIGLLMLYINSESWGYLVYPEMLKFPDWAK